MIMGIAVSDLIKFVRLNLSQNSSAISYPEQSSIFMSKLKSPTTIILSNLLTALFKDSDKSPIKVSIFKEDDGLYTLTQKHLFLDMVISEHTILLRFVSRSLSLLVIIHFFTNSVDPPSFLSSLLHNPLCEIV